MSSSIRSATATRTFPARSSAPGAERRSIAAKIRIAAAALALALAPAASASGLGQLKSFLEGTRTARGTFQQTVVNQSKRTTQNGGGTFAFARPGKFRWTYTKPFAQTIVGDGAKVWVFDPDLNQVIVKKLDVALGSTPAALLAGDNALETHFNLAEGGTAGDLEYVDATPKDESQFTRVRLGFRENLPRAMELTDTFGQTTKLEFTTIERNPTLASDLFRFTPPQGADVVGE
jgi:outer membrane lipoprotein carrier protein